MSRNRSLMVVVLGLVISLTSCVSHDSYRRSENARINTEKALSDLKSRQGELENINASLKAKVTDLSSRAVAPDQLARLQEMLSRFRGSGLLTQDGWGVTEGKLSYTIKGSVLFSSGQAAVTTEGKQVLAEVVQVMKDQATRLEIRGHTDSDPIRKSKWKSNMDLGLARAYAVWDELGRRGFPREMMIVSSCGPYRPKQEESTEEGKRQNRRVEILLLETKGN